MTLKIRENTVVPYPANELPALVKVLETDGILMTIQDNANVTPPTVRSIVETGKGRYSKVKALREFVIAWNKQFAA